MNTPATGKILLLAANPIGSRYLRLGEEMREIEEGLKRSKNRERYSLATAQAVRYRDIHRAILEHEPQIIHFSGHGAGEEGLVFEDETGAAKLVDAEALAGLFQLFSGQVECVVLNACYSQVQAEAIAQHIPCVIGMKKAIGDRAAIEFAVGFYDALGANKDYEFAYKLGCNAIRMAGISEQDIPTFLKTAEIESMSAKAQPPQSASSDVSTTQFDVFLAHNTQDKPEVRAIALTLKQRNIKSWIDEEQIPPGRSFQDEIQQAIPLVKSAAIFIGSQGLGRWQSWELKAFIAECVDNKIPVIPVLLPGVNNLPENLVFLKQLRWVAFSNGVDDENALDLLQWGITGKKTENREKLEQEQKPGSIPPKIVLEEVERLGNDEYRSQPILNSENLKQVNNNDLQNAQFGGGFVSADKVIAGQIGGDVYNINIDFSQQTPAEVKNIVDRIEPILERLQQIHQPESPGVVKAGNPGKSLAYWQGRESEIAQIQQWLIDENVFLIGIEGIGGTGKSMLAAKILDEIAGFPKRFWADVSNGASFSDLAREVLTEFGFRLPGKEVQLVDALVKCLRSGQFLLIIDNLESVLQPDRQWASLLYGDFFQAWIESGANSKVLITTRERPKLKGFQWINLKGLQVDEGIALLTELGIKGNLAEFVKLVDGHPLLLKLVADLLKEEYSQDPDLSRLADLGLGNLRQLLTDPQVVGVHRRENVGMVLVLDASFERLSELQRRLLLNISVYRGAIDSAVAIAVLSEISQQEIEREMRNLVKRSWLLDKLNGKQWFEFQPVVLEYVRYKAGDQTEAHQLAIDYYRSKAKQPPWTTKDDVKEYLEIFYHFYQLQDYNSAFDSIWVCNDFLTLRGYYTEQVELFRQLVSKWEEIGDRENWNYQASLISLGNTFYFLGQYQQQIGCYQQSLDISREQGDINGESNSLNGLGTAYNSLGEYQRAISFLQQSLEIKRKINDRKGEGIALNNLGYAYNSLGQYQQAIDFSQQSLEIHRQIGDLSGKSIAFGNLGSAYNSLGQYQQAIYFYQQSLAVARERGDLYGESNFLMGLGNVYNSLGRYQWAINFYQQSFKIKKEIGDLNGEGSLLNNLGNTYCLLGQYQRSINFYQQSLEISRQIGNRNGESNSLNNLGNAYRYLEQYQLAINFHQQSLDIAREIGDIQGEADSWFNLGLALEYVNRKSDALVAYRNSLALSKTMGIDAYVQDCNNAIKRLS